MADIRCPRCQWHYSPGVQWSCSPDGCGEAFDTFATGGKCPRCDAQFTVTWCPACGQPSPHKSWYASSSG